MSANPHSCVICVMVLVVFSNSQCALESLIFREMADGGCLACIANARLSSVNDIDSCSAIAVMDIGWLI